MADAVTIERHPLIARAKDLVAHFTGRGYRGKAMMVCIDKATAVRMYDKVQAHRKAEIARLKAALDAARSGTGRPFPDERRTVEAVIWRQRNGAKWRSLPPELGPWWKAAQIFIRWARLGVWDRLLDMAKARGVELGMAFIDGTSVRAHAKAAGAAKKGDLREATIKVKRLGVLVAALAQRRS